MWCLNQNISGANSQTTNQNVLISLIKINVIVLVFTLLVSPNQEKLKSYLFTESKVINFTVTSLERNYSGMEHVSPVVGARALK